MALTLIAVLAGYAYLHGIGQPPSYRVLVATHDLPRGHVLSAEDLDPAQVPLPDSMAAGVLQADDAAAAVGAQLAEPLHTGVPLLRAQLAGPSTAPAGYQRVAFPIGSEHASSGHINQGDVVRVYVTHDRGKAEARTDLALDRATVSNLGYDDSFFGNAGAQTDASGGSAGAAGKLAWIEVQVASDQAQQFIQTISSGDPDVAVLGADGADPGQP
jgi:hypothetical protein